MYFDKLQLHRELPHLHCWRERDEALFGASASYIAYMKHAPQKCLEKVRAGELGSIYTTGCQTRATVSLKSSIGTIDASSIERAKYSESPRSYPDLKRPSTRIHTHTHTHTHTHIYPRIGETIRPKMSLIPSTMFRDWWDDFERPSRLLDQHFGLGLTRDELFNSLALPPSRSYFRPWRSLLDRSSGGGVSKVQQDRDKFQVIVDVQQFAPSEITVKTLDNSIVVEGKHEEKKDEHGYISRQFVRRYLLPEGHDVDNVHSSLSSDGVLTVTAPALALPAATGEKVIPIEHTSAPAVKNV